MSLPLLIICSMSPPASCGPCSLFLCVLHTPGRHQTLEVRLAEARNWGVEKRRLQTAEKSGSGIGMVNAERDLQRADGMKALNKYGRGCKMLQQGSTGL